MLSKILSSEQAAYRLALILMIVSSVGFSLNGLIVRSLDVATPWQVLFWRGFGVLASQGLILLWSSRTTLATQFLGIGRWGIVASVLNGCSPIFFLFALINTSVANVVFLMSAMPFVSALMARIVLGERIHKATLYAIPAAFIGIGIMVGGSVLAGAWLGNVFAFCTVLVFSIFVVILRYSRGRNMQPVLVLGGVVSMAFAAAVTGGAVMLPAHDLLLCFTLGFVITGFGHLMFMKAAQILPAGEVTFLMLIEFVLAPLWVWAFVDEVPRPATLIGGGIVLATVAAWAFYRSRTAAGPSS